VTTNGNGVEVVQGQLLNAPAEQAQDPAQSAPTAQAAEVLPLAQIADTDDALAGYSQPKREEIIAYGKRIKAFLRGSQGMQNEEAYALANIALAHGLDPFVGEIWWIRNIGIVMGIEGYRKSARKIAPFSKSFRQLTPEEIDQHRIDPERQVPIICQVYRFDLLQQSIALNKAAGADILPIKPFEGLGMWTQGDNIPKTKTPMWVARKRAEADALRQAYDLTFGYTEAPAEQDIYIGEATMQTAEIELTGEALASARDALYIEDTPQAPAPQERKAPNLDKAKANGSRPYDPATIKKAMEQRVNASTSTDPASQKQVGLLASMLNLAFEGQDDPNLHRRLVIKWLFDAGSTKELSKVEAMAALDWLIDQEGEGYVLHPAAEAECAAIVKQAQLDAGQQALFPRDEAEL